jgi:hypothetical protein
VNLRSELKNCTFEVIAFITQQSLSPTQLHSSLKHHLHLLSESISYGGALDKRADRACVALMQESEWPSEHLKRPQEVKRNIWRFDIRKVIPAFGLKDAVKCTMNGPYRHSSSLHQSAKLPG